MAIIIVFALLAILSALAMANANTVRRLHNELRLVEKRQLRKFQTPKPIRVTLPSQSDTNITVSPIQTPQTEAH